jgi:hypothetical protein
MKFFEKIRGLLQRSADNRPRKWAGFDDLLENLSPAVDNEPQERRSHFRQNLICINPAYRGLITIEVVDRSSRLLGEIENLSYGGALIRLPLDSSLTPNEVAVPIRLSFLDQSKDAQGYIRWRIAAKSGIDCGIKFNHDDSKCLVFLQKILEPMSWGDSMRPIHRDVIHEKFSGGDYSCLRGLGPTDLTIDKAMQSFHFRFRLGTDYHEVLVESQNGVKTGTAVKKRGFGGIALLGQDQADENLIRIALYIMLGMKLEIRSLVEQAIPICCATLGIKAQLRSL